MKNSSYLPLLLLLLVIKAVFAVLLIHYSHIGLAPDEAQYWTWSQQLDWGYYSKPPGIAWQIWLSTKFFGNTELGIRFGSVVISALLSLSMYVLAKACDLKEDTAFWSSVVMSFCPIGILSSFAATTDGGFILFWTLASASFAYSLRSTTAPEYLLIGILIALGALFKWPIYALWALILFFSYSHYPKETLKRLPLGFFASLLGLLPSFIWNYSHEWSTFRHVINTLLPSSLTPQNSDKPFWNGNVLEFLGAQAGILSPIFFILLLCGLYAFFKKRKEVNPAILFCGVTTAVFLSFCVGLSLFKHMQANWGAYTYPTAVIILCWFAVEQISSGKMWLKVGTAFSITLSALVIATPRIQENNLLGSFSIPYKANAFRHSLGWDTLESELQAAGYQSEEHFLFSDKYQMSSILSFYSEGQKRAYFLNLHGNRKNQFSFWPGMKEEQMGKTGFFVLAENEPHFEKNLDYQLSHYQEQLSPYFHKLEYLGSKSLFQANGSSAKGIIIFKCIGYNGLEPISPTLY
ncbi:MAG: hypothetical protein ACI9S8_001402 [Chlamydiales bacterium]|jgi:hypothetical protein